MPNLSHGSHAPRSPHERAEAAEQRNARLVRERALLDEARAGFEQGLTMDKGDVEAWLNALGTDEDRPLPKVRRPDPGHGS